MCTTHADIITNMHVQFESIIFIHVVFGKTQTCIIFCFIFTKGLMEHWSMVRGRGLHKLWGGLSITSFWLTGPAHCPPQRQRWIFKRGERRQLRSRECISEGRGFVSPLTPSKLYYTIHLTTNVLVSQISSDWWTESHLGIVLRSPCSWSDKNAIH